MSRNIKKFIAWALPINIIVWLAIGLFSLVDATVARSNPMGFGNAVLLSYGMVFGVVTLAYLFIGLMSVFDWLDDWSER